MQYAGFVIEYVNCGEVAFIGPFSTHSQALSKYEQIVNNGAKNVRICQLVASANPQLF